MYISVDNNVFLVELVKMDDGTTLENVKVVLDDEFMLVRGEDGKSHWYNRDHIFALHGIKKIRDWDWNQGR